MQRPAAQTSETHHRRGQQGSSLPEVMVAVTVMGIALIGIVTGYFTTVTASSEVGRRAARESVLNKMGDGLANLSYRQCATLSQINADFDALPRPAGYAASITSIRYLEAGSGEFTTTCTKDRGAQLVTIKVVSTGPVVRATSGQVVIRNPTARAS